MDDNTPREIGRIDERLRLVIRGLAAGELPWPFFLTGDAGRGKSAAALCLADHVAGSAYYRFTRFLKAFDWSRTEGGVLVKKWRPASTLENEPRMNRDEVGMSEREFWAYLSASPLVVIDDLGTRGGYTEPQYDQFYDLVEDRKFKPLVVVSNHPLAKLSEVFDDRIVSRLAQGTQFTISGRDRRLDGKK